MKSVVVIPTYYEAANIRAVLDGVLAPSPDIDVLVVDDNSPDGTAAWCAAHPQFGNRVHLLSRPGKAGLGAAYRAGFAWALDAGYDAVVQMDADLSHPPERVPALLGGAGATPTSRSGRATSAAARVRDWPLRRRLISWAGNLYVRMVLGLPVHDATAGFKAFRREALVADRVPRLGVERLLLPDREHLAGEPARAAVTEVPITFTDRGLGESKMIRRHRARGDARGCWSGGGTSSVRPTPARYAARQEPATMPRSDLLLAADSPEVLPSWRSAGPATSSTSPRSTCCAPRVLGAATRRGAGRGGRRSPWW